MDDGDTGWWKLWEKKQVTWAKGEWNFIYMEYVVWIPTGASKWYPAKQKQKQKPQNQQTWSSEKRSGWRCNFGNYLLMVVVKARAWVRRPRVELWSWRAGGQGPALGAVVAAGWAEEGGLYSRLETIRRSEESQKGAEPQSSTAELHVGFLSREVLHIKKILQLYYGIDYIL